jgi:hypothetical protein
MQRRPCEKPEHDTIPGYRELYKPLVDSRMRH